MWMIYPFLQTEYRFKRIISLHWQIKLWIDIRAGGLFFVTPYWRVPRKTKQLSTVVDLGLLRAPNHIGLLTSFFLRTVYQLFIY